MGDSAYRAPVVPAPGVSGYVIGLACFSLLLLLGSVAVGQLWRLPLFGQGGGLLLSDLAVVFVLLVACLYGFFKLIHKKPFPRHFFRLLLIITPFVLWALFGLVIASHNLARSEIFISFAYYVRLVVLLYLLPALILLLEHSAIRSWTQKVFLATILFVSLLGLLQLAFMPSISSLTKFGWDPHEGRLVSSWLDPNLVGGFFLLVLPFVALEAYKKKSLLSVLLLMLVSISLLLTKSRSSFLALAVGIALTLPFLVIFIQTGKRKIQRTTILISLLCLLGAGGLLGAFSLGDRFIGFFKGDATTALRVRSLTAVWNNLALPNSWLGIGYNTYQFSAQKEGFIQGFSIHSRAGSDNSLLNIWVTTGIFGLILFSLPWLYVGYASLYAWHNQRNLSALAVLLGLLFIVIHSQAVNSLLYGHIVITLDLMCALGLCRS